MIGLLLAAAAVALSSAAGLGLSRRLPWSVEARDSWLPQATGLALAPMLLGLCTVLVLWAWPGQPPGWRVGAVFSLLAALCLVAWVMARRSREPGPRPPPLQALGGDARARWVAALLAFSLLVLLALAAFIPITQNDALEYAIVGRELHAAGDLRVYPLLDSAGSRSGFFGPWTHPPLYVSLIALAFALQGQDDGTLLARLISPWFLCAATLVVAAIGGLGGHVRRACLAGVLFVAAPLLYLGAASSLIDSLPVLGLALALAMIVGLEAPPWRRGAMTGAAIGVALWTHSVAVIFPALLVPAVWWRVRSQRGSAAALKELAAMCLAAGAIGCWPYLRNIVLFGNPVSDNPAVFALASLDWKSYFTVMRGVGTTAELVQYGLFKGWFAVESYSLVFWLALVGLAHAWSTWRGGSAAVPMSAGTALASAAGGPVLVVAAIVGLVYHGLVVLSLLLGVDVMVRNERYMLVIMPCMALLAASALDGAPARGGRARALVLGALAAFTLAQLAAMMVYRGLPVWKAAVVARGERLDWWAPLGVQQDLAKLPPSARVLTLKPADMFYSRRRMLSYLDPSMLDFYRLQDPAQGTRWLAGRGVTHIHLPDYWLPPLYNSTLDDLLADPGLTQLVADEGGYQVFGLRAEAAGRAVCHRRSLGPWRRSEELIFGGRKTILRGDLGSTPYLAGTRSDAWNRWPLFLRESSTVLRSERLALPEGGAERLVEIDVAGDGYVLVYLIAHAGAKGGTTQTRLLADLPLREGQPARRLKRRVLLPEGTEAISLSVEHRGRSHLTLGGASLAAVCENGPR